MAVRDRTRLIGRLPNPFLAAGILPALNQWLTPAGFHNYQKNKEVFFAPAVAAAFVNNSL
jgi:hypothetical protein